MNIRDYTSSWCVEFCIQRKCVSFCLFCYAARHAGILVPCPTRDPGMQALQWKCGVLTMEQSGYSQGMGLFIPSKTGQKNPILLDLHTTECIHFVFVSTYTHTHMHTHNTHSCNCHHNPVFTFSFLYNPVFSVLVKFIEAEFTFSKAHNSMSWDKRI